VDSVGVSSDGRIIASGSLEGDRVIAWNFDSSNVLYSIDLKVGVRCLATSLDDKYLVCGLKNGSLAIFALRTGELVREVHIHDDCILSVAIAGQGRTIVTASADKAIKIVAIESGKVLRTLSGHSGMVRSLAISHDGRYVVSGSADGTVKIWSLKDGRLLHTFTHDNSDDDGVFWVGITPNSKMAFSAAEEAEGGSIIAWRVPTLKD
jgi:WD40 repeat protein